MNDAYKRMGLRFELGLCLLVLKEDETVADGRHRESGQEAN